MLSELNPEQRQAASSSADFLSINAGAGTGKTKTLTTRIRYLIENGCPPEEIMATTFTRKAAHEMRERVGLDASGSFIGTMHAYCYRLVMRWQHYLNFGQDFMLCTNTEIQSLIDMSVHEACDFSDMSSSQKKEVLKDSLEFYKKLVARWKENGVTDQDVLKKKEGGDEFIREQCSVFLAYNRLLRERSMVDAADLILGALSLLNNESVLEHETKSIRHVLVDEFQDTNLSQLNLLRLLCSKGACLTIVGDDDQSLYSFRGSIPSMMKRSEDLFADIYRNRVIEHVTLFRNYRCTDNILEPANALVNLNSNHNDNMKSLESGRSGDNPLLTAAANAKAEATGIVKIITTLLHDKRKVPYKNIAILARKNAVLTEIETALRKKSIPYVLNSGTSFFDRSEVSDVLAYMKLAVHPGYDLAIRRVLTRPTRGVGATTGDVIVKLMHDEGLSAFEAIGALLEVNRIRGEKAKIGADALKVHLFVLNIMFQSDKTPFELIEYILNDIGYLAWVKKQYEGKDQELKRRLNNLSLLYTMAKESKTMSDFVESTGLDGVIEKDDSDEDCVFLSSIHGSKGLEWDYVFIPGYEKGILPMVTSTPSGVWSDDIWSLDEFGGLEEERRLGHVGLTRARNAVFLSFCLSRPGQKQNSGPSPFIEEAGLTIPDTSKAANMLRAQNSFRNRQSTWRHSR